MSVPAPSSFVVCQSQTRGIHTKHSYPANYSSKPTSISAEGYVCTMRPVASFMSRTSCSLHRSLAQSLWKPRKESLTDSVQSFGLAASGNIPKRGCWCSKQSDVAVSSVKDVTKIAQLIDGQAIAADIRKEIAREVSILKEKTGRVPGLAVVLVGERKDSATYVRMKKKACDEVGIVSVGVDLPANSTELDVLKCVEELNADPNVHGVLVQLPLPKHMNEERIVGGVSIHKDVDGFHPLNMGKLAMTGRQPLFVPCTPLGCIELLRRTGVKMEGQQAVVIGRSNVVGMPAALLLQRENATVTIVHSQTLEPAMVTRRADIVIAAAGVPYLVKEDWIKPGAVVIDVGINAVEDKSTARGYRLVGDVCFEEVKKVASAITPVPGGVGPMTIAMLLRNTLTSAQRAYNVDSD